MTTPNDAARDAKWLRFFEILTAHFGICMLNDVVTFDIAGCLRIQVRQAAYTINVHITDDETHPLTKVQRDELRADCWRAPETAYGHAWSKFIRWHPGEECFGAAASLIVWALHAVLRVASPDDLETDGINDQTGADFALPVSHRALARAQTRREERMDELRVNDQSLRALLTSLPTARLVATIEHPAEARPTVRAPGRYARDDVLLVGGPDPHILVFAHLGRDNQVGQRKVAPYPPHGSDIIIATQLHTTYVRDLLSHPTLTEVREADPALNTQLHALLASQSPTAVQASYARTRDGDLAIIPYKLNPAHLGLDTFQLPPLHPDPEPS